MPSLLQIVAEPMRERILQLVWSEERSAGDIARALPVTFGAVSQHLRRLHAAGVVDVRREGKFRYYRANQEALGPVAAMLHALWGDQLEKLKMLAELEERRQPRKGRRRT